MRSPAVWAQGHLRAELLSENQEGLEQLDRRLRPKILTAGLEDEPIFKTLDAHYIRALLKLRNEVLIPEVNGLLASSPKSLGREDRMLIRALRKFLSEKPKGEDVVINPKSGDIVAAVAVLNSQEKMIGYAIAIALRSRGSLHVNRAEIAEIAVAPSWRNRGLGKGVFEEILEKIESVPGITRVYARDHSQLGHIGTIALSLDFTGNGKDLQNQPIYYLDIGPDSAGLEEAHWLERESSLLFIYSKELSSGA